MLLPISTIRNHFNHSNKYFHFYKTFWEVKLGDNWQPLKCNSCCSHTWCSFSCTTGIRVNSSAHWVSIWPSAVLRPAVSTLFNRRSWLPVLSTDERKDDFASTSLENSYQKQKWQWQKLESNHLLIILILLLAVWYIFCCSCDSQTNQECIEVVSDSLQLLRHCYWLGGPELQPVQSRLQPVAQLCWLTLVPEIYTQDKIWYFHLVLTASERFRR